MLAAQPVLDKIGYGNILRGSSVTVKSHPYGREHVEEPTWENESKEWLLLGGERKGGEDGWHASVPIWAQARRSPHPNNLFS